MLHFILIVFGFKVISSLRINGFSIKYIGTSASIPMNGRIFLFFLQFLNADIRHKIK